MDIIWHFAKKELIQIFREPKFWIPFLIPAIFFLLLQIFWLMTSEDLGPIIDSGYTMIFIGIFMSPMGIALNADSFAGERERNSLELLLNLPVSIYKIFFGKLLASLLFPMVLILIGQLALWAFIPSISFELFLKCFSFSIFYLLIISGIAMLLSLRAKTVRSASQMSTIFFLLMTLALQLLIGQYLAIEWSGFMVAGVSIALFGLMVWIGVGRFQGLREGN